MSSGATPSGRLPCFPSPPDKEVDLTARGCRIRNAVGFSCAVFSKRDYVSPPILRSQSQYVGVCVTVGLAPNWHTK